MPLRLDLRQNRAQTDAVEEQAATIAGLVAQMSALLAQIDQARDTLVDWRSSAIMILDDHGDRLETLENAALTFDSRLDALESSVQTAAAALQNHASRLTALENWRTQATALVQALSTDLDDLTARVEALESE